MALFLSDEWFEKMQAKLSAVELPMDLFESSGESLEEHEPVVVQHLIKDVPSGGATLEYSIRIHRGGTDIQRGRAKDPDLWITTSYGVALALAKGEIDPYQALLEGFIKLRGNLAVLTKVSIVIAEVLHRLLEIED